MTVECFFRRVHHLLAIQPIDSVIRVASILELNEGKTTGLACYPHARNAAEAFEFLLKVILKHSFANISRGYVDRRHFSLQSRIQ